MPEVVQVPKLPEVTEGSARPAARKGPRGQVVIFGTWCKGCGLCVEFCPAGVLDLDREGRPFVIAPEKCTACHWCDTHCPDLAIVVKRIGDQDRGRPSAARETRWSVRKVAT